MDDTNAICAFLDELDEHEEVVKADEGPSASDNELPVLQYPPLCLSHSGRIEVAVSQPPYERARRLESISASYTGSGSGHLDSNGGMQIDVFHVLERSLPHGEVFAFLLKPAKPAEHPSIPFSTSGFVYVPCTYTLLDHLLRHPDVLQDRRVIELGAGLGLCSCVIQQHSPPPAHLLATDGDERVLPLLAANLQVDLISIQPNPI